jgi:hypothetical protein
VLVVSVNCWMLIFLVILYCPAVSYNIYKRTNRELVVYFQCWFIFHFIALFLEMISDFMTKVVWSDRDYLIIDTPPGTSDEHISVIQNLRSYNPDGAILVTTPQV